MKNFVTHQRILYKGKHKNQIYFNIFSI